MVVHAAARPALVHLVAQAAAHLHRVHRVRLAPGHPAQAAQVAPRAVLRAAHLVLIAPIVLHLVLRVVAPVVLAPRVVPPPGKYLLERFYHKRKI